MLRRGDEGPNGGAIFDVPVTVHIPGRGWVTCWSEVFAEGGISKRMYERSATDAEVFTAQMDDLIVGFARFIKSSHDE